MVELTYKYFSRSHKVFTKQMGLFISGCVLISWLELPLLHLYFTAFTSNYCSVSVMFIETFFLWLFTNIILTGIFSLLVSISYFLVTCLSLFIRSYSLHYKYWFQKYNKICIKFQKLCYLFWAIRDGFQHVGKKLGVMCSWFSYNYYKLISACWKEIRSHL